MTTDTPDAAAAQKPTIVLIHGLWLTPLSWEGWKQRFESKGHTVLAPAWPGLEGTVEEVRRNTSRYERLGIKEITDPTTGASAVSAPRQSSWATRSAALSHSSF
jgi:non-heme chloroperoxidase